MIDKGPPNANQNPGSIEITVWDGLVRLLHWGLVAAISAAAITGFLLDASWIAVHVWAAAIAMGLVIVRIIWAVWGGTYARFDSFDMGPKKGWLHFKLLLNGQDKRYVGHNPLGGAMVVALIAVIMAIITSGSVLLGSALKAGPLAFVLSYELSGPAQEIHKVLAIGLLVLIALHVGGVVFESLRHEENLAHAMVTGKKHLQVGDVTSTPRKARVGLAVLVSAIFLGGGAWMATVLAARVPQNMPVAEINPLVADECSACHMIYHPSLLSADNWERIISTLEDHYGEDASLDDAATAEIKAWMMANAAHTADTRASHVFDISQIDQGKPRSIVQTNFWKARHAQFGDDVFSRKGIFSRSNCLACHKDAEAGLFSPFNIYIP